MKTINKCLSAGLLLAGITLAGCSKNFLDVNKDPNRVTDDNVTAALIFTRAEVGVGDRMVGGNAAAAGAKLPKQFVYDWIGYMAQNGDFARDEDETTYNLSFGFGDVLWGRYYDVLFDLYKVKTKAIQEKDTALAGAAMVLSADLFQHLVDLFGDIPYSQAFQSAKYSHPVYDKAPDIYEALQHSLDTAIAYLQYPASTQFESADVINQGNTTLWTKFANTLKLRLLIRQSEVAGFDPAAEITKIMNNGGVLGAGESVSVNPGYTDQLDKQSPFYANFGYTPTGSKATTSNNANAYIIDILSNSDDPRISRFFAPVESDFIGVKYGDQPGNLPSGKESSYFGPALISSSNQDQWIYPSFEAMFLYAEAVVRGWIPDDHNSQAAYEAAVKESFKWLQVPDAESAAEHYMNGNDIADWANAGSTVTEKIKFIAFQKYIANTCIDPLESYADQRRLHFLPPGFISLNTGKLSDKLPLRLAYVQSEYTTNAKNVNAVGQIDVFKTKLFWEP